MSRGTRGKLRDMTARAYQELCDSQHYISVLYSAYESADADYAELMDRLGTAIEGLKAVLLDFWKLEFCSSAESIMKYH